MPVSFFTPNVTPAWIIEPLSNSVVTVLLNIVDLRASNWHGLIVGLVCGLSSSIPTLASRMGLFRRFLSGNLLLRGVARENLRLGSGNSGVLLVLDELVEVGEHDMVISLWLEMHFCVFSVEVLE